MQGSAASKCFELQRFAENCDQDGRKPCLFVGRSQECGKPKSAVSQAFCRNFRKNPATDIAGWHSRGQGFKSPILHWTYGDWLIGWPHFLVAKDPGRGNDQGAERRTFQARQIRLQGSSCNASLRIARLGAWWFGQIGDGLRRRQVRLVQGKHNKRRALLK